MAKPGMSMAQALKAALLKQAVPEADVADLQKAVAKKPRKPVEKQIRSDVGGPGRNKMPLPPGEVYGKLSITMGETQKANLEFLANQQGVSVSYLVRTAIAELLARNGFES